MPLLLVLVLCLLYPTLSPACTVVSAVDADGQVWNMNNEDGPPAVANFINVFPRTAATKYGYYTLSYLTPEAGSGANTQGGMNEAGLTYDFNAIGQVEDFDPATRRAYPDGNDAILAHVLGNLKSVDEVIALFETYWFVDGFTSAQMHVADRSGKFAIIRASGVRVAEPGEPLVSTNFDICGGEDGGSCWRYPVAERKLASREVGLATMLSIALDTRQKGYTTVYSNVQNLTTGDIWFASYRDPDRIAQVNIAELLERGAHAYSFRNLDAVAHGPSPGAERRKLTGIQLPVDSLAGTYWNDYVTDVTVVGDSAGIRVGYANGNEDVLVARPDGSFVLPEGGEAIAFERDGDSGRMLLHLYLDDRWALTAQRKAGGVGE